MFFYVCVCGGGGGGVLSWFIFSIFFFAFFSLNIKKHSHNLLYIYRRNFWFHFCWILVIKVDSLENLHYNFYVIPKGKRHESYECKLLCKFLQLLNMITGILMAPRWVECFVNLSRKFCLWRFLFHFLHSYCFANGLFVCLIP